MRRLALVLLLGFGCSDEPAKAKLKSGAQKRIEALQQGQCMRQSDGTYLVVTGFPKHDEMLVARWLGDGWGLSHPTSTSVLADLDGAEPSRCPERGVRPR